eukprot:gene3809-6319_t
MGMGLIAISYRPHDRMCPTTTAPDTALLDRPSCRRRAALPCGCSHLFCKSCQSQGRGSSSFEVGRLELVSRTH